MSADQPGLLVRGRAWRFGDDISTDALSPGAYAVAPAAERARHTLEAVNPRFAVEVRPGDVVVAGRNFGCGSSRETAPEGLKALGVGCVVAVSFARLFLRNAVAIGLPALPCAGAAAAVGEGDAVEVDLETGTVRNTATGVAAPGQPLPAPMLEMLRAGGIRPLLRRHARSAGSGRR
jgi:3-isopropylmalate/(R)-2-methylmalate dehydratase small subunit